MRFHIFILEKTLEYRKKNSFFKDLMFQYGETIWLKSKKLHRNLFSYRIFVRKNCVLCKFTSFFNRQNDNQKMQNVN
jgi:hypothetical protein